VLLLLVLLPFTVTAVPVTIERTVTGFAWDHVGPVDGFKVTCNGVVVADVFDPLARSVSISGMTLTPDSPQACTLSAYIVYSNVGEIRSEETEPLAFFTVGSVPKVNLTVEAPDAPSNFGLTY